MAVDVEALRARISNSGPPMQSVLERVTALSVATVCVTSAAVQAASADADKFPAKPIRLIVPFVAGVGTDRIRQVEGSRRGHRPEAAVTRGSRGNGCVRSG